MSTPSLPLPLPLPPTSGLTRVELLGVRSAAGAEDAAFIGATLLDTLAAHRNVQPSFKLCGHGPYGAALTPYKLSQPMPVSKKRGGPKSK